MKVATEIYSSKIFLTVFEGERGWPTASVTQALSTITDLLLLPICAYVFPVTCEVVLKGPIAVEISID